MPNRSCDFCLNVYRKEPSVGYFKLTSYMKIKLGLLDAEADYICGLHFEPESFSENGRLKPNAVPTFFPSRSNLLHDHPYYSLGGGGELSSESHTDREESEEYGKYVRLIRLLHTLLLSIATLHFLISDSEELPKAQSGSVNIEDDDQIYNEDNEVLDPNYTPDSGDLSLQSQSSNVEPEQESDSSLHQQSCVRSSLCFFLAD